MIEAEPVLQAALLIVFIATQGLYFTALAVDSYFYSLPVNWVNTKWVKYTPHDELPYIVQFYPVLREPEATMHTTMLAIAEIDYPADKFCVIAIPNSDDLQTIESLRRLQASFPFLQILEVPPTSDATWQPVWKSWQANGKAYWWHHGAQSGNRNLPPKKTRQLIYALYVTFDAFKEWGEFIVSYIDADSAPPRDHFLAAAAGIHQYDVLQATNIAGNLNDSMAASWHALDHIAWDGMKYKHLSADGRQPYWMLGKGLFFRASDLVWLGGFNPWVTIEDPEVGMRFWANGMRLGIIENPLIEEVPTTLGGGILQRKRWVCGFFQSLGKPLKLMGMTPWDRFKARLNFVPCLALAINPIGLPFGAWVAWRYFEGRGVLPDWTIPIAVTSLALSFLFLLSLYVVAWQRTALVLDSFAARIWYMIRICPPSVLFWWLLWVVPLVGGLRMYLKGGGLVWERTEKIDANHHLVRTQLAGPASGMLMTSPADTYARKANL